MKRRSGFGFLELIIGILLIVLGIFTFINPGHALTGLVFVYGLIAVGMGIADILLYVRVERYTGLGPIVSLVSGILSVMSGIMLLVYPGAGKWVLSLLFPIWFFAHCISRLAHVNTIRTLAGNAAYFFTLVLNILGLLLGCMMILHPVLSLMSISYIVGFYLLFLGIDSVVLALSRLGERK